MADLTLQERIHVAGVIAEANGFSNTAQALRDLGSQFRNLQDPKKETAQHDFTRLELAEAHQEPHQKSDLARSTHVTAI